MGSIMHLPSLSLMDSKSGHIMCYKRGHFYLLTTGKNKRHKGNNICMLLNMNITYFNLTEA
jgi:hypothetical protein